MDSLNQLFAEPLLWLIWLPLMWAPVVYLVGRISDRATGTAVSVARWAALLALLSTWLPLLAVWSQSRSGLTPSYTYGMITLRADGLSLLLATVVLTLATLAVLFSSHDMAGQLGQSKYYAMIVAMSGAMIGLGCAGDLFNLWLWFEAMSVSSYLLVAFYRDEPLALEAGLKYLVQGATGSVFVLLGVALVLAQTGALDLAEIAAYTAVTPLSWTLIAAGACFVIGYGVKVALVPLHTWLPDAHSQAPSTISALLSGVVIEAGLIAMLRALAPLSGTAVTWGILLILFGILNMFLGNLLALRQGQVKRMLAFSSVAHIGYIVTGLGMALAFSQYAAAYGGFFHLVTHMLMKGLAFLAAGALLYGLHSAADEGHSPLLINQLGGAAGRYPLLALVFSVALLGLGGLPPLAGFMSKWSIMVAGAETYNTFILVVVALVAVNSVLSLAYYAPLVNRMYRNEPSTAVLAGRPVPALMQAPLVVLAAGVLVVGLWPAAVTELVAPAAAALLTAFGV
jgi:proton-translocating NADH-quinone oxidoreductase chain N